MCACVCACKKWLAVHHVRGMVWYITVYVPSTLIPVKPSPGSVLLKQGISVFTTGSLCAREDC